MHTDVEKKCICALCDGGLKINVHFLSRRLVRASQGKAPISEKAERFTSRSGPGPWRGS